MRLPLAAAQVPPDELEHGGLEEDEDPGVDDGVEGEHAQGVQVAGLPLLRPAEEVDGHPQLEEEEGAESGR